jgi:hypothetical protein
MPHAQDDKSTLNLPGIGHELCDDRRRGLISSLGYPQVLRRIT